MNKLNNLVQELESNIANHELLNNAVSESPVGWHIEHSLLTINLIIGALQHSNPNLYKWEFKLPRLLVFTTGKIPRGRAKAPKVVVPKQYDSQSLNQHIFKANEQLKALALISKDHFFEHPYFGHLKQKQTIKFLKIHTQHHLDIINDIVKKSK